nr:IS3 family transposase [Xanthomonas sp. SHU 308]
MSELLTLFKRGGRPPLPWRNRSGRESGSAPATPAGHHVRALSNLSGLGEVQAALQQHFSTLVCDAFLGGLARATRLLMGCPGKQAKSNAVAESFFQLLKRERIRRQDLRTRDDARADVFKHIEMFYNQTRRHSTADGLSPEQFEQRHFQRLKSV